jgi:hypothetical protein
MPPDRSGQWRGSLRRGVVRPVSVRGVPTRAPGGDELRAPARIIIVVIIGGQRPSPVNTRRHAAG